MMLSNGIIKELTALDDGSAASNSSTTVSSSSNTTGQGGQGLFLKFPFLACFLTALSVLLLVQSANRHGFQRDFQVTSHKILNSFFYESQMKVYVVHDASVTAANIAMQKPRKWRKGRLEAPNQAALELFDERTLPMRQFGQVDRLTWYPLDLFNTDHTNSLSKNKQKHKSTAKNTLTCETERTCKGGKIRGQALAITEESKSPVTSEVFFRPGESLEDIKTAIFYPVLRMNMNKRDLVAQPEDVIGAVSLEFLWRDFFSPTTFSEENEALVIVFENTCGQAYTFRVKESRLAFMGEGYLYDPKFNDMMVTSEWSDFIKPGTSKILHRRRPGTEDWICGCEYRIKIVPSKEMFTLYTSSWPRMVIMGSTLALLTLFLSFLAYDIYVTRRYSHVSQDLSRFNSIVGSLFPEVVLDRVVDESIGLQVGEAMRTKRHRDYDLKDAAVTYDDSDFVHSNRYLAEYKFPIDAYGTITEKPIYNSFPHSTISFMDISGFTSWSSERDPEQVFMLLESVYQKIDRIATRLNVFKIETIGDCYVAVTGVPEPQKDHCLLMCRFAYEAMVSFVHLTKSLEVSLGPGTADLALRVGIHSGPVIAGVLRAEKVRFQLFGDTMNVASRMESTGKPHRIQLSKDSALLLEVAGKGTWLEKRSDVVTVKGKGFMTTYWLKMSAAGTKLPASAITGGIWGDDVNVEDAQSAEESLASKRERLIDWNTEVLLDLLRKVVARRKAIERRNRRSNVPVRNRDKDSNRIEYQKFLASRCLVDHVSEAIPFASFEEDLEDEDPNSINLGPDVEAQLRAYVAECASLYNDVKFHNFEHASHVVMSAKKLLGRIISPEQGGFQQVQTNALGGAKNSRRFHDRTFGISCDPLMHFAMAQAALIHDVGHMGVSNKQLVKHNKDMAARYSGQSVAEQHSLFLSMHVFAEGKYADLREALLADDPKETERYYQFMLSSVLATDIADKDLREARQKRWDVAFEDELNAKNDKDRLYLDAFYLGELSRVDLHIKVLAACSAIVWFLLVCISYWATPAENIEPLVGVEQKAAGTACAFMVCGFLYKAVPQLLKMFDYQAQPMSGVVMGVITIQTIAMITDFMMASGYPTPVMIDPVLGTRVHLLRWCEWTPLAFYIYFITDGVDVPDKQVGLKSRYFFAGCQGLSTFCGLLFPFAPNGIVWGLIMIFSVALFLFLYPHLNYKRKLFSRMERGVSADDKEIYDRAKHAMSFLEDVAWTWGVIVTLYFVEGLGPMITSLFDFTRSEGFGMTWTCILDCISKMQYVNNIMDIHTLVFDTSAREERQKEESIRLKHESNKKATILFEYIIQASDVAHCMQHWSIYQKWNRNLFEEMLRAYLKGDSDEDPRPGWYNGEIWFFDNYVIPLATKLTDSGCFGVSGAMYLRSAVENRNEWKLKGQEITSKMIAEVEAQLGVRKSRRKDALEMDHSRETQSTGMIESDSERSFPSTKANTTPLTIFCSPRQHGKK